MITYSIIQKSKLEGAWRIDAEYYQPGYAVLINKLRNNEITSIDEISEKVTQGPNPAFISEGKPCLNGRNIKSYRVNILDSNYVSEEEFKNFSAFKVKPGDILITLKGLGSIGKIGYVFEDVDAIFSRDIGLIRTKENSESLFAFLLSKYGVVQIERSSTGGTGQRTLTTSYIKQFQIPKFTLQVTSVLKKLINNSELENQNSFSYYQQAENLFLVDLGLKDVFFENDLSYVVNFSDIARANRMDAEYFQPKYQKLIDKIKSQNAKTLGELVSMRKGFEPGSEAYQENGKLFIRVSSVSKLGIEEKDQKYLSEELYQKLKKDYEPKLGDILLTKDATPGIAYVIKEPLEGIISGGILDLKVNDGIESEYLALCISSIVGQWQAQRDAGGSIIAHWKPEQVRNLIIPILPIEKQKEITGLVRKSHEAGKKSKEFLEEAKKKVEEMIEKGGGN